jgi:hypothetical protein
MGNIPRNVRCVGSLSVGGNRNEGTRTGPFRHDIRPTVSKCRGICMCHMEERILIG